MQSDRSVVSSFVAYYEPGPKWLKGKALKEQPLKTHVDYMLALHDRGKLIMGGPLADGSGALVVFAAENIGEVEEMLSSDPAIADGILVASVKEWSRIV